MDIKYCPYCGSDYLDGKYRFLDGSNHAAIFVCLRCGRKIKLSLIEDLDKEN